MKDVAVEVQGNWLFVKGRVLSADVLLTDRHSHLTVGSDELRTILTLGRTTILEGIDLSYERLRAQRPDHAVSRPSIWTAQLATQAQVSGLDNVVLRPQSSGQTDLFNEKNALYPIFHGHWDAVHDAGFVPEVRRVRSTKANGAWLFLRRPTVDDVLKNWLDYQEADDAQHVRDRMQTGYVAGEKHAAAIGFYSDIQKEYTAKRVDRSDVVKLARQRIGIQLARATMKLCGYDHDGYAEEVESIFDTIDAAVDRPTVLAIENAVWRS